MTHGMTHRKTRARWMTLALMATAASACAPANAQRVEPLLPMDEKAPAFIAAHCAVPVTVGRTTARHGLAQHGLVRHVCDDQRDNAKRTLSMVVQFDETTRQITELQLLVSAGASAVVDAEFDRVYAAMIDPYVTPAMRGTIRQFSRQTFGGGGHDWWELDHPGGSFKITAQGGSESHRWLEIRLPVNDAR